MKSHYIKVLLLCSWFGLSQIPSGYYNSANGTGYDLKTQLHNIINNHNDQGYNAIDNFFENYDLDTYYENDNTILDVYSENPNTSDPYNFIPNTNACGNYSAEGDCYNKEHVIPQSVFGSNAPMQGDAHHLLPTDGRVNGFRSNYPMGRVDTNNLVSQSGISNPTQNGSLLGNNLNSGYSSGYSGIVFEPIDEFKGDIARIYFYFATRYENLIESWSNYDMFNGTNDQVFETAFLNILLEWHNADPVSQKEIDRNNAIYYQHQGNRNPFVDHPEYVAAIWSGGQDSEAPSIPTNIAANNPTATSIDLSWNASTDNIAVSSYDIYKNGTFELSTSNTNVTITGLNPETNYCFSVSAKDAANNSSGNSAQACETTLANSVSEVDLFFTEYMEGSSFNKALEIGNFTGATIALSNYSIKLSTNGNSSWTATYQFPSNASISNNEVYVIGHGSMAVCTDAIDDLNNTIAAFNGNDVLGLFKNEVLIDIIGTLGQDIDFGVNTTLVRNSNIETGNTIFDASEWTSYSSNTCNDLGQHTQLLGLNNAIVENIKIYPNPIHNTSLNIVVSEQINVALFDLLGNLLLETKLHQTLTTLNVEMLSSGIYILKLSNKKGSVSRKIIKQ